MKSQKLKIYKFKDNIFSCEVMLIIGKHSAYRGYMRMVYKYDVGDQENWGGEVYRLSLEGSGREIQVVWMPYFKNVKIDQAILVHELTHVVSNVFKHIGVEHTKENDELYAYYLESIYLFFINKLTASPGGRKRDSSKVVPSKKRK